MQHVCFERSQSISQSTGKPVAGQTQRLKTSQELEETTESRRYWKSRGNIFSREQSPRSWSMGPKQGLPKILFLNWKTRVNSKKWKWGVPMMDTLISEVNEIYFTEKLADRERVLWDTNTRGIHEFEALNRSQNLRVDEFSKKKIFEDHHTIEELTGTLRELQNEINCMIDSRDSRTLNLYAVNNYLTFPVNRRYVLFLLIQEECLAALKICSPIFGTSTKYRETFFFANSPAYSSASCLRTLNSRDDTAAGKLPAQQSTGQRVAGVGDKNRDTVLTPRFPWSPSAGNSFYPMDGEISRIMVQTNKDFR